MYGAIRNLLSKALAIISRSETVRKHLNTWRENNIINNIIIYNNKLERESSSPGCFGAGQGSRAGLKGWAGRKEGGTGQRGVGGQLLCALVTAVRAPWCGLEMTIIALGQQGDFPQHRSDQDLHCASTRQRQIMKMRKNPHQLPPPYGFIFSSGTFPLKHYCPCNSLFCYVITYLNQFKKIYTDNRYWYSALCTCGQASSF